MQVANEQEVKGQIKLRFTTAAGQPVVVARSFSVGGARRATAGGGQTWAGREGNGTGGQARGKG